MAESQAKKQADIFIKPSLNNVSDKKTISLSDKIIKPRPIKKTMYAEIYHELQSINPDETILWIGKSSQLINLMAFIVCAIFSFLLVPILIAYIIYLQTKNKIYVLTTERLRVYSGIITKQINDLELYRVKDTRYEQPFLFRFFGLSNIQLFTSDITWGESVIPGIENGMTLREKIRKIVEAARAKKGVREFDYYTRTVPPPGVG